MEDINKNTTATKPAQNYQQPIYKDPDTYVNTSTYVFGTIQNDRVQPPTVATQHTKSSTISQRVSSPPKTRILETIREEVIQEDMSGGNTPIRLPAHSSTIQNSSYTTTNNNPTTSIVDNGRQQQYVFTTGTYNQPSNEGNKIGRIIQQSSLLNTKNGPSFQNTSPSVTIHAPIPQPSTYYQSTFVEDSIPYNNRPSSSSTDRIVIRSSRSNSPMTPYNNHVASNQILTQHLQSSPHDSIRILQGNTRGTYDDVTRESRSYYLDDKRGSLEYSKEDSNSKRSSADPISANLRSSLEA